MPGTAPDTSLVDMLGKPLGIGLGQPLFALEHRIPIDPRQDRLFQEPSGTTCLCAVPGKAGKEFSAIAKFRKDDFAVLNCERARPIAVIGQR